ncbi:hypothetical protein LshimejAT787_0705750 [Lyophyllum shimeji]|uniref:Uncharacterized protein n=1 Tax=Lyophyllum shimeji TaxID=47721 RepID=A0A9P3PP59_LYOSH|nr:hypothetical protein LshimejAT787_0705750 [Lyophyllum shimeji]
MCDILKPPFLTFEGDKSSCRSEVTGLPRLCWWIKELCPRPALDGIHDNIKSAQANYSRAWQALRLQGLTDALSTRRAWPRLEGGLWSLCCRCRSTANGCVPGGGSRILSLGARGPQAATRLRALGRWLGHLRLRRFHRRLDFLDIRGLKILLLRRSTESFRGLCGTHCKVCRHAQFNIVIQFHDHTFSSCYSPSHGHIRRLISFPLIEHGVVKFIRNVKLDDGLRARLEFNRADVNGGCTSSKKSTYMNQLLLHSTRKLQDHPYFNDTNLGIVC